MLGVSKLCINMLMVANHYSNNNSAHNTFQVIMQQLYAIPAELRALRQFVLWKYVDVGAAKPTKVPYQINGEKADVNNPFSWSSFEECFNALSSWWIRWSWICLYR
jgi:hypothetical protein